MKSSPESHRFITTIGLLFLIAGIALNEWTLGILITHDGVITSLPARVMVWVFQLISVVTGFIFLKYKSWIRLRWKEIMFSALIFLLFIFMCELSLRLFYYIKGRDMNFSDYVGWQARENIHWKKEIDGYGEIEFSTSKYGFRVFGNIDTNKFKIFVIGDSYTHGTTVSDGNTYYDYLRKNHDNIEIFAYGAGGYGSLQEYMILNKYFDMIKPDMILWQFCSNDIINNSFELESLSNINNSHNTRPYYDYEIGQITLLYPRQYVGWFDKIVRHSYLLKLASIRLDILNAEISETVEDGLSIDQELAREAVQTTSAIMGLVRKRAGSIPIVAFSTDNEQLRWSRDVFSNISRKHLIHYIDYVPDVLAEAKSGGVTIDAPNNAHWNDVGNAIAGKTILNYLINHNMLIK
jgi:hypothetical protein